MKDIIIANIQSSIAAKQAVLSDAALLQAIGQAAQRMLNVARAGGTIYVCGNGGSACDSMHFVEELVARFKKERKGIRAAHFLDSATLSCWSNDYDYESAFERSADTFCTAKDLLVVITTSGNSKNVIRAAKRAREKGSAVIGLLGKGGGAIAPLCDVPLVAPSVDTERIQEVHIMLIHIFCELLDDKFASP